MNQIVLGILYWYQKNLRNLPWRSTNDPFKIWLSEVILQQTQVVQGTVYYEKFIENFSNIKQLANAEEEQILKLWQGLGYYSRARNLHKAAQHIINNFNGVFPNNYKDLLKLPGVGDYTASAIASFAYNLPHPTLDGNVYRFIARLYNINLPIDEPRNKSVFINILMELMEGQEPRQFNNAMMEMGAIICKPQNPQCNICPVADYCEALKNNTVENLPVKSKKVKVQIRHLNYFFIEYNNGFYLEKRMGSGIWQNLFQLPLIETLSEGTKEILLSQINLILNNKSTMDIHFEKDMRHILTHQRLEVKFWKIQLNIEPEFTNKKMVHTNLSEYKNYAVPKLIENYLLLL